MGHTDKEVRVAASAAFFNHLLGNLKQKSCLESDSCALPIEVHYILPFTN